MLLTLMLTSKGVAGVPRASLVVIAATLSQFSLPEEGLLLVLGIDTFLDMGRSATNVIGNSLATAVVAKWEGQLIADEDTAGDDRGNGGRTAYEARWPRSAGGAVRLRGDARAQDDAVLSGTLKTINDRGSILIGYRDSAPPFSFLNPGHQPVGFSLDLCHGIAEDVARASNRDLLEADAPAWQTGVRIIYVPVTADQRLPKLVSGAIDLECGSTTANADRREDRGLLAGVLPGRHQAAGPAEQRPTRGLLLSRAGRRRSSPSASARPMRPSCAGWQPPSRPRSP